MIVDAVYPDKYGSIQTLQFLNHGILNKYPWVKINGFHNKKKGKKKTSIKFATSKTC